MNKFIISLGLTAGALAANGQGIIAGWDFSDNPGVSSPVGDYAAEFKTSSNNGYATDGTLKTASYAQKPGAGYQVSFFSSGAAAEGDAFTNGFDNSADKALGAAVGSGQQSFGFTNLTSDFSFEIDFTAATDVVMNFDYAMNSGNFGDPTTGDFINVEYFDGASWNAWNPNAGGPFGGPDYELYEATVGTWGSTTLTGTFHNPTFIGAGQTDGVIDLSALGEVSGIRLTVDASATAADIVAFDNIIVTGTAVPEPSTYAAIFGVVALAIAAVRRRK